MVWLNMIVSYDEMDVSRNKGSLLAWWLFGVVLRIGWIDGLMDHRARPGTDNEPPSIR